MHYKGDKGDKVANLRYVVLVITMLLMTFSGVTYAKKKVDESNQSNRKDETLSLLVRIDQKLSIDAEIKKIIQAMEERASIHHTTSQTIYWAEEAKKVLERFMYAYGYYDSTIDAHISADDKSIIFNVTANERYKIAKVEIKYVANSNYKVNIPQITELLVHTGHFAIAKNILESQEQILRYIEDNNCLRDLQVSHTALLDHVNKEVTISFLVHAGSAAVVGSIGFSGLHNVHQDYVQKLVGLKSNQCFKHTYLNKARSELRKTGLFNSINPVIADVDSKNDPIALPIMFEFSERKPRSVKVGIIYGSDLGVGGNFSWEHRNFLGAGELVKTNLLGNQKEQIAELNYTKPFFQRDDQKLKLGSRFENKKSKAFDSKEVSISSFIERDIAAWKAGLGLRLSNAVVKPVGIDNAKQKYALISTPMFLIYDTKDRFFNPSKGYEVKLDITPFAGFTAKDKCFLKEQISLATYLSLDTPPTKPTLALRIKGGNINGINIDQIPRTERFYVGGGDSVRGYAYQLVGNLDANNKPLGGKSFIETTVELRLYVTQEVMAVGFIDSGFAYESFESLKMNGKTKVLHGIGGGIRYITPFGAFRADIGVPVKRRKHIDKPFQIYLGIGQSF